ncbi:PLP-dependent transferase [Arenibacter algicola]|uniref:threonine aldolase family protein n=1 Tax=Arenibacter algicola TaxID=616991 RepID=UPI001C065E7A|nr:GntG family PLP-dependent aldolase [Arenibacter algicola]MBU2905389.1 PLP-dependent transferase [Arenibacter algicola]
MFINLISDTVTKPTPGMLQAMMTAEVGDDVFKNDPTVNKLEEMMANLFGMEAALFFPSGTMANQTAIKLHTQPGEQLICDKYAHVYNYEGGGVSFNSGVSCRLVDGHRGMMTASQVEEVINPPDFYHSPLTSLVCIENTTNKGGGACWDLEELKSIKKVCERHNLKYHLDGARLWNALIAKKESALDYGALFHTISVCLSKGLGCPVGSVLLGDKEHIDKALRVRKVLGGGMRQAGYLAAAGIYALENNRERLAEDHRKAKEISVLLNGLSYIKKVEPTETNIVIFEIDEKYMSSDDFMDKLNKRNVQIIGMGQNKLRIVTHMDYTDEMHEAFLDMLPKL